MTYKPNLINIKVGGADDGEDIAAYEHIEDLAFAYWQYNANEKAYANKLITQDMHEYARNELQKSIDRLSKIYRL